MCAFVASPRSTPPFVSARARSLSRSPICSRARRSPSSTPSRTFFSPSFTASPSTGRTICATNASLPGRRHAANGPHPHRTRQQALLWPRGPLFSSRRGFRRAQHSLLRRPAWPSRPHLERAPRQALSGSLRRRAQHHRRQPRLRPPLQPALCHRIPALPRDAAPKASCPHARSAPLRPLPRVQSRRSALSPTRRGPRLHQAAILSRTAANSIVASRTFWRRLRYPSLLSLPS